MLTIKRVATVVSNYQEDSEAQRQSVGCGRNCLAKCCLAVSKLPIYAFKKDEYKPTHIDSVSNSDEQSSLAFLNNLVLGQWEDRLSRGLFRYDVTTCKTKVIPGKCGFIGQLNEGRHLKKRPTEFRVDRVLQSFDESKFNFTKIGQEEVLFRFEPSEDDESHFFPSMQVNADVDSPSVVAINVSPIEYGHVLLIPRVLDCLPQMINLDSFLLPLHMAREAADPFFRVGYNSLGAFATINHLHFQAYYLSAPFPVEKAATRKITTGKGLAESGVMVLRLLEYPVKGLVFAGGNTIHDLSEAVASSCICLQKKNIPFNVLIAECGRRIFLFPQCYAEKQALGKVSQEILNTQVNPAVWEISGHMVLKSRKDFDDASEDSACRMLAEVSLSEVRFQEVIAYILEAAGLQSSGSKETSMNEEDESLHTPCTPQVASHLAQNCMVLH